MFITLRLPTGGQSDGPLTPLKSASVKRRFPQRCIDDRTRGPVVWEPKIDRAIYIVEDDGRTYRLPEASASVSRR